MYKAVNDPIYLATHDAVELIKDVAGTIVHRVSSNDPSPNKYYRIYVHPEDASMRIFRFVNGPPAHDYIPTQGRYVGVDHGFAVDNGRITVTYGTLHDNVTNLNTVAVLAYRQDEARDLFEHIATFLMTGTKPVATEPDPV